jgi:hypothetical protein
MAGDPSARPTRRMQSAWLMHVWVQGELTLVSAHESARAFKNGPEKCLIPESIIKKLELLLFLVLIEELRVKK